MQQQENNKNNSIKEAFQTLIDNKIVKGGIIILGSVGAIWILGKVFHVFGGAVRSFKSMADSFRN